MLKLCRVHCPEIAGLAYWLYERESDLLTREGTTLKSSNGVHQGCRLANILFGLLIYHINARLTHPGVRTKQYFWDDMVGVGTPEGLVWTLRALQDMRDEIGLKVRLDKCHLYCPSLEKAEECKNLLQQEGFDFYGEDGGWLLLKLATMVFLGSRCTLE